MGNIAVVWGESFVAEETAESDALNLASSTKVQSLVKTRFRKSAHVHKSEEICGQIPQAVAMNRFDVPPLSHRERGTETRSARQNAAVHCDFRRAQVCSNGQGKIDERPQ